jgi:hypothetical protein
MVDRHDWIQGQRREPFKDLGPKLPASGLVDMPGRHDEDVKSDG